MQAELSKWRHAMADRIRELLVDKADAEDIRKAAEEKIADIDQEMNKIDEALDRDGRDRSTIHG